MLDRFWLLVTYTGDGWGQAITIVILSLINRTRKLGLLCLASWLSSGAVRLIIVQLIRRERPSNYAFANPLEPIYGSTSFPSGHTTTSFAIAAALMFYVRGTKFAWLGWVAMVWASLVAISRIVVGIHYPVDVVAGAALGIGAAALCAEWFTKRGWLGEQPAESK